MFEEVFWCLEWEGCTFFKRTDENVFKIQIHQYYIVFYDFDIHSLQIAKLLVILPTVNTLIQRSGHYMYNTCKFSTIVCFQYILNCYGLMFINKMQC